jgi:hypothetical protein
MADMKTENGKTEDQISRVKRLPRKRRIGRKCALIVLVCLLGAGFGYTAFAAGDGEMSEAYKAILEQHRAAIERNETEAAGEWRGHAAPVVITDVTGDDTPELIFLTTQGTYETEYDVLYDLYVYGYDGSAARERLHVERLGDREWNEDSAAFAVAARGGNGLLLYSQSRGSDIDHTLWTVYSLYSFPSDFGESSVERLQRDEVIASPGAAEKRLVYRYDDGNIDRLEYEAMENAFLADSRLLFKHGPSNLYTDLKHLDQNAMTYAEAIAFLSAGAAAARTAVPTASTVLVNGAAVPFDAYNIDDNNYFKLRDLAYILSGTEKQFEVTWDGAANAITLTSGSSYTAVGGEMAGRSAVEGAASSGHWAATATTSKIRLDGRAVAFTAYNIGGNNYFKLRDLGAAFDFGVDWDGAQNTVVVDTGKGYTPE